MLRRFAAERPGSIVSNSSPSRSARRARRWSASTAGTIYTYGLEESDLEAFFDHLAWIDVQ